MVDGRVDAPTSHNANTDSVHRHVRRSHNCEHIQQNISGSHYVQHMKLGLQQWAGSMRVLADGLRESKSLRWLHLTSGRPTHIQVAQPIDLSPIFAALCEGESQLQDLKLDCEFATGRSLAALCNLLQQPSCQLKSLEVTFYTESCHDALALIQAAKNSPSLKKLDLILQDSCSPVTEVLDRNSTFALVVEAMKSTPHQSNLTHLSICNNGLEQPLSPCHLKGILQQMESNIHLESVKLKMWYKAADGQFEHQLQSFCTRNVALKLAESLDHCGVVDPEILSCTLEGIEKHCPSSVEHQFLNIWFCFLRSRPHDIEKYNPKYDQSTERKQPEEPKARSFEPKRSCKFEFLIVAIAIFFSIRYACVRKDSSLSFHEILASVKQEENASHAILSIS